MSGCEGCFNKDQNYATTRTKAVEFAKEKEVTVAICREGQGYVFYEAAIAREITGVQIIEYITKSN